MTRSERDEGKDRDEQRLQRVLGAAAAREDEVPEPSPFLAARLRARFAEAQQAGAAPPLLSGIGTLAWRVMPALVLALALLGVWTGVEQARATEADDDAVTTLAEPADLVGDALGDEPQEDAR